MTVFAKAFFTLVGCHLVAFSFLSAWHGWNYVIVRKYVYFSRGGVPVRHDLFCFLHLFHEHLCGLECGDAVLGDDDGSIL